MKPWLFAPESINTNRFDDFFAENGFCVVAGLIDQQTIIKPLIAEYTKLVTSLWQAWRTEGLVAKSAAGMSVQDMLIHIYSANLDIFPHLDISLPTANVTHDSPIYLGTAIFELMRCPALLETVQHFLGQEVTLNPIQHVRLKPPSNQIAVDETRSHIAATSWHQDMGVTLEEANQTKMLTTWVAISDCPEESGCLRVIPKSHRKGLLEHCPIPQIGIPDAHIPDIWNIEPLPVKSGSVVFFNPYVIHGASANVSQQLRWSFDLRYNVTGAPTGRPQFPEFVICSQTQPVCDYSDWRAGWLKAKDQLAVMNVDSSSFSRWNADAPFCA